TRPGWPRLPARPGACRPRRSGRRRHGAPTAGSTRGEISGTRHGPTPGKGERTPRRLSAATPAAPARMAPRIWRAMAGSGSPHSTSRTPTVPTTGERILMLLAVVCCAAARGASLLGARTRPTASTTIRRRSAATSASALSFRPWLSVVADYCILLSVDERAYGCSEGAGDSRAVLAWFAPASAPAVSLPEGVAGGPGWPTGPHRRWGRRRAGDLRWGRVAQG